MRAQWRTTGYWVWNHVCVTQVTNLKTSACYEMTPISNENRSDLGESVQDSTYEYV